MAFDAVPGGDPRGPWCPKCSRPIQPHEPKTIMHNTNDPYGEHGGSRPWHAECARPYWDTLTPLLERMRGMWGGPA